MKQKKEIWIKLFPYSIFLFCCLNIFFRPILNMDEIWNYNFASNIFIGRLPYRDFNIIQTPLSSYSAIPFLFLFGNRLFSMRIATYLLMFLILVFFYKICMIFCKCVPVSVIVSVFINLLSLNIIIYNYNSLNLCIVLFFIWKELKLRTNDEKDYSIKFCIILGITSGIIILIKQTTGLFMILANIVISLYDYKNQKYTLKKSIIRIGVSFIPLVIFLGYLLGLDIMDDFLEYAVFGIKNFTHRFSFFQFLKLSVGTLSSGIIFIMIILLSLLKMIMNKSKRKIIFIYLIIVFSNLIVAYPLCDPTHFYIVFMIEIPIIFFIFEFKALKDREFMLIIFFTVIFSFINFSMGNVLFEDNYKFSDLKHFEYIPIDIEAENTIKK